MQEQFSAGASRHLLPVEKESGDVAATGLQPADLRK
jgi:hypothetical protein